MALFPIADAIGTVSSLFGMLSSASAERQAEEQRQMYLNQFASQNDGLYQNTLSTNNQTLQQRAGLGGDAIQAMGRRLGDSLAAAGVTNSSATAGAMVSAQRENNTALANLAAQLQAEAWRQRQQGLMEISKMGMGYANEDYNYARTENSSYVNGLIGGLAKLGQDAENSAAKSPHSLQSTAQSSAQGTASPAVNLQNEAKQLTGSINDFSPTTISLPGVAAATQGAFMPQFLRRGLGGIRSWVHPTQSGWPSFHSITGFSGGGLDAMNGTNSARNYAQSGANLYQNMLQGY